MSTLLVMMQRSAVKVLQYTGGGGGGGGGGTISFQSAADEVQPSRPQTVHFQARAHFFNTFMPVSLNIDLVITL